MNAKSIYIATALTIFTAASTACEKWKSEIANTVYDMGIYINAYHRLDSQKISKNTFFSQANVITEKLQHIKDRTQSIASCTDNEKYEHRRQVLLTTLNYAIPIAKYGKYLAPERRDELKRHED